MAIASKNNATVEDMGIPAAGTPAADLSKPVFNAKNLESRPGAMWDDLIIEDKVKPADIAFIKPGLPAAV